MFGPRTRSRAATMSASRRAMSWPTVGAPRQPPIHKAPLASAPSALASGPCSRGCPLADDVILCASGLAANSALHSYSAKPGGQFTVRAAAGRQAWIAVDDNRGPWINPALRGGPSPARVMGSTSSAPSPPHGASRATIATGPSGAV